MNHKRDAIEGFISDKLPALVEEELQGDAEAAGQEALQATVFNHVKGENEYEHSSWLALMESRVRTAHPWSLRMASSAQRLTTTSYINWR